ncbi:MAG: RNA polymerase factor sigma-54 [Erysipelotrichaceae bacterium]
MKLENTLKQKLLQNQTLSIKQQYSLKVLEMNTADLLDTIIEELEINPVLEANYEVYSLQSKRREDGFDLMMNYIVEEERLTDVLLRQCNTYHKDINEQLGEFIINSLDPDGYLRMDSKDIAVLTNCNEDEVEEMINIIQTFEPYGVCARNLRECLIIQLSNLKNEYVLTAIDIVYEYLTLLSENKLPLIAERLHKSLEEINQAVALIKKLDPKPGYRYASSSATIEPDIKVYLDDDEIKIRLLSDQYDLRINQQYKNTKDEAIIKYLAKHMKQAELLIDSMIKRNRTLFAISDCIVRKQQGYFLNNAQLLPLTMKEIAEEIGIHESTISRSIANKYMEFNQRMIPLKFFFTSKLESGESSNEVQLKIIELIKNEDKKKPLSDACIVTLLEKENIKISRRTVAKYRDILNIPATTKRKQF